MKGANITEEAQPSNEDTTEGGNKLGIRHVQLFLFFLGAMVVFMTRFNVSLAIVIMTDTNKTHSYTTFKMDEELKGTILSSFYWGLVVFTLPAAVMNQRFNPKFLLGLVVTINGILTLLCPPLVHYFGPAMMIFLRIGQGMSQGFFMPVMFGFLSRWIPNLEMAKAGAILMGGTNMGTTAIMFASGYIGESKYGWPLIFYSSGAAAIVWVILWWLLGATSPDTHPWISIEEKLYIKTSLGDKLNTTSVKKIQWKQILTSKSVWAIALAYVGQNWGMTSQLTLMPSFISSALDFDISQDGELSALPYLLMFLAAIPLSAIADNLIQRDIMTVNFSRKLCNSIGQIGSGIFLIIIPFMAKRSPDVTVVIYIVATIINSCTHFGFMVSSMDISPNFSDIVISFANTLASIASVLGPLYAGVIITDETSIDEWKKVFFMSAAFYIFGAVAFLVLGEAEVQPWNYSSDTDSLTDCKEHVQYIRSIKNGNSSQPSEKVVITRGHHPSDTVRISEIYPTENWQNGRRFSSKVIKSEMFKC